MYSVQRKPPDHCTLYNSPHPTMRLTYEQRLLICKHKTTHQSLSQAALAAWAKEHTVEEDLTNALHQLPLHSPMSIESLVNPIGEDGMAHVELEDDEIVTMVRCEDEAELEPEPESLNRSLLRQKNSIACASSYLSGCG